MYVAACCSLPFPCVASEELMEQVDQLEAMHEQRVELLTRSIRKVVQSKKRRREEGEEEVGGVSEKEGEEEVGGVSEKRGPLCFSMYVHVLFCHLVHTCVCVCV